MATNSTMLELGTWAPGFALPEVEGGATVSLDDFAGAPVLVVAFLSNHCPYVRHVQESLAALAKEYHDQGVGFVAISSNDVERFPDDAPDALAAQKRAAGFPFPYLYDATQEVAKAYRAACTPDFYVFDSDRTLVYRGRLDSSRPGGEEPTGEDLRAAIDAALAGQDAPAEQWPSTGCGIKWRPGKEPDYLERRGSG